MTLKDAHAKGLELVEPFVCSSTTSSYEALERCKGLPVLVVGNNGPDGLIGIATPFDLL
jgi:hypothetical protein